MSVEPQRATILIVEDEPNVGKLTRRILERGGYRALLAASPSEALATASAEPDIQMLLTDVVLPEMIEAILRGDSEASARLGAGESAPHE